MNYPFDNEVMVDLETVGKAAGCGILSIGASTLDRKLSFYVNIDIISCYDVGLKDDPSTLMWWNEQPEEARIEAFNGKLHIKEALTVFSSWYKRTKSPTLWGNGSDFDKPILEAAYNACGIEVPWKYNAGRCYRTLKVLYPQVVAAPFAGVKHCAIDDAENQARHCHAILRHIYGGS